MKRVIVVVLALWCRGLIAMEEENPQDLRVTVPEHHFIDLEAFDINHDGVLDEDEEKLAQYAVSLYFKQRRTGYHTILPSLRRHIHAASSSPGTPEGDSILALRRMVSTNSIMAGDQALTYLQNLVLKATADALVETEGIASRRISKKTAAIGSSVIGLLGIASTLLVHYTQGNCS